MPRKKERATVRLGFPFDDVDFEDLDVEDLDQESCQVD